MLLAWSEYLPTVRLHGIPSTVPIHPTAHYSVHSVMIPSGIKQSKASDRIPTARYKALHVI